MSATAQASPTRTALRVPDVSRSPPRRAPPATAKPAAPVAPLRVSRPSDPAEGEAVRIAQRVLAMAPAAATPQARRFAKAVPARTSARSLLPPSLGVGTSVGQPLPRGLRHDMEPRFGADFSAVRVHTGEQAARASRRLNAAAFTVGHEVFFGRGRFAPGSREGRSLIAHELTHTIQQGGAAQPGTAHRSVDTTVRVRSEPQVQRLGVQDALDYFAGKADSIPGFSMLALVLGMNPINGRAVDRSPANVLRALVRFVPGGDLIVKALDTYSVFDKVANWFSQQVDSLGMVGATFKQSVFDYADSLGPGALLDLGGAWNGAKRIFTAPWEQIKTFVAGLAGDILALIKDAVLKPLAALAEGTPAYPLLKAVLGKDPVTGEESPGDAQAILGGVMTLAGQGEVWGRVQSTGAIGRVVAWFNDAKKALVGFVKQVPALAVAAFKSLELMDIVVLPRAFAKVGAVFGNFVASFIGWGVGSALKLAEIVFEVVSPGAWGTIQKTGAALKSIVKDPLPFVGNLGKAAKLGFQNFAGNFLTHLQNGLIKWLTGSLSGVYIPTALTLPEIVKFAFSVLGLSWANLRGKLVKAIGATAVGLLEKGFAIVVTLKNQGPAAAWEQVRAELAALKDQVIEGIKAMIVEAVVTKAIPKLVAMFIPGAGFISAIVSIYDMVMVFVNKISEIAAVVSAFVGSISAIAGGAIGAAAGKVESVLAGGLSLAINFLAGFAGLGKIAAKVNGILQKIRAPIDKALDSMVAWIRKVAKKFLDALLGKKDKKGKDGKPDARTPAQMNADLQRAVAEAEALMSRKDATPGSVRKGLRPIQNKYRLSKLALVKDAATPKSETDHVVAEINPTLQGKPHAMELPNFLVVNLGSVKTTPASAAAPAPANPSAIAHAPASSAARSAQPGQAGAPEGWEKEVANQVAASTGTPPPNVGSKSRWPGGGMPANTTLLTNPKTNMGGGRDSKDVFGRPDLVVLMPGAAPRIEAIESTLDANFVIPAGGENAPRVTEPHKAVQLAATVFAIGRKYPGVPIVYTIRCPQDPGPNAVKHVNAQLRNVAAGANVTVIWVSG